MLLFFYHHTRFFYSGVPCFGILRLTLAMLFLTKEATCLLTNEQRVEVFVQATWHPPYGIFSELELPFEDLWCTACYIQLDY